MDINLLKKLVKLVETSDITDFSVEEGDLKVSISKKQPAQAMVSLPAPAAAYAPTVQENAPQPVQPAALNAPENNSENLHEIKSPIVGTFYRAPAPDADPYIQVGQQVSEGTVLCIVEAMKLMNEIESDIGGKVVKVLVENATPVEYNQPLFLIEKS